MKKYLTSSNASSEVLNVLLQNGGFEIDENGSVPGWHPDGASTKVSVDQEVFFEGKSSLVIEDASPEDILGVISNPMEVDSFKNVILNVKVLKKSGSGGKIDFRFFDQDGKLLSVVSSLIDNEVSENENWQDVRLAAASPKNAAYFKVAFYSPAEKVGVYYADDAKITLSKAPGKITNLGPQSTSLTIMTGDYGKDKSGRDVMYTVAQGDPAKFIVSDVHTKQIYDQEPLVALDGSHAIAAWAITVASDGKVYIGSTPNGTLFQYDPNTESMRTIGKPVPTDTVIWVLTPGKDGKVYGGTGYSQSIFEYDPVTDQSKVLTTFKTSSKESHVRALAFDEERNTLYVGGADVAKLYKYNLTTGEKSLIIGFGGKTSVYDLKYTAGKLFIRVDPGPIMYVYTPENNTLIVKENSEYNTRGFSPVSPDGRVFYTYYELKQEGGNQWSLYAYDVNSGEYGSLGVDVKGAGIAFAYVELNDPKFPGVTLVGLAGNSGRAFYYNLETGYLETPELPLPPQFVELHNIGKSVDGKILSSGFISGGGLGVYSPTQDQTTLYPSLGQVEGYGILNGKVYFGVYPKASIFEYDPSKPWNRTDPSEPYNPPRLAQLGNEQDRPVAMVGVEEENKLYIGTYPIAGKTGGALTIYDPITGLFDVKRNIVPEHSINTILYKDGKFFLGTGAMDDSASAKLAIYVTKKGIIEFETIPVEGKKAISGFVWGPDGNIWGMALGTLFIFDPNTKEVIYRDDKFPTADFAHSNPRLMIGTDGNVYGSIFIGYVAEKTYTSKFIKIDAATKEVEVLLEGNVEKLAQDDFGNFYFKYGSELMKYSDPKLVVKLKEVKSEIEDSQLKPTETTKINISAILENGMTTKELSGADIEYKLSNSKVAEIDKDGTIVAKHPGRTLIAVTVTLNGVTVTSNPIMLQVIGPFPEK
ncbi:PQQ-like beta-propeller repeat protein [Bacillus sp. FJAT-49705]|uniref:PQQ-like beta-propeller repeat protein n=1 Tax=Cytobacillus citreus TaxID=2833586 RepID=A0ABS5NXH8_9BACI|nr:PQQ-like beta-propeller repeat protein [Cytobacillus citreus]MBS4191599.1 PQQ-like beta-propeller repeat protein [Cytobacillus citreus]